ncbi:MAG: hypothetical protein GY714_08050 [Desulfobacterales bacterium]|nr:hypothetical protein [Desulfobacterales bacterium]
MATQTIEVYAPKTAKYINSVDYNRQGHHNHVITQKFLNLSTPLIRKTANSLKELDTELLQYLKYLDTPIEEL